MKKLILIPLLFLSCKTPYQHIYSVGDRVRTIHCQCKVDTGRVDSVIYRGVDASEYRVVALDTVFIWDVNLLGR